MFEEVRGKIVTTNMYLHIDIPHILLSWMKQLLSLASILRQMSIRRPKVGVGGLVNCGLEAIVKSIKESLLKV